MDRLRHLVVFTSIIAITRGQTIGVSAQQFQTPQKFAPPQQQFSQDVQTSQQFDQGRFSQQRPFPSGQEVAPFPQFIPSPGQFPVQASRQLQTPTNLNSATATVKPTIQRVRRPQSDGPRPIQPAPQPIGSIPTSPQQTVRTQQASVQTHIPTSQRQQPIRQEFFETPQTFPAPPPPPVSHVQTDVSLRQPVRLRDQDPFSTSRKTQEEIDNEYNDKILRHQAESAQYTFSASVNDSLNDNQLNREETRDGLNLYGKYSYSDGYVKRTVYYEADEKGYRIVKEESEPLGDGPQLNPDGSADVASNVGGTKVQYTITSADIKEREPHTASTLASRKPQQSPQAFPSRQFQQTAQRQTQRTQSFQDPTFTQTPQQTQSFQDTRQFEQPQQQPQPFQAPPQFTQPQKQNSFQGSRQFQQRQQPQSFQGSRQFNQQDEFDSQQL